MDFGKYTISATYSGDINYASSNAPPTVVTIQPDYSLTASSTSVTIPSPGGTGSSMLTISPINGFSGSVSFSCSDLPAMRVVNLAQRQLAVTGALR